MAERLVIDMTGRGGLANKWGGDVNVSGYNGYTQVGQPNLRYNAEDNQIVSGIHNPIVKYGFLSPAAKTINVISRVIEDHSTARMVDDTERRIYFADGENNLIYGDYSGDFTQVSLGSNAFTRPTDMCVYYLNGVRTGFVIGRTGMDSRIKTFTLTGTPTPNSDWSLNDVTNGFTMPQTYANKLIPSGDGFLYVLNKNSVHRIDGTTVGGANGTIYRDVLRGPDETYLTHGAEYNNYLYIVVQKNENWEDTINATEPETSSSVTGNVGVYVWNRQSTFFNSSNYIEIPGVSHVRAIWVTPKNELMLMAVSGTSETLLMKFNGQRFTVDKQLPYGSFPLSDSAVWVYGSFSYWAGSDGLIYMYGSELPGEPDSLCVFGQYNSGGVESSNGLSMVIVSSSLSAFSGPANTKNVTDVMYIAGEFDTNDFAVKQFFINPYNKITFT